MKLLIGEKIQHYRKKNDMTQQFPAGSEIAVTRISPFCPDFLMPSASPSTN